MLKIKNFDTKALDEIIEKMMDTVGNSKNEIFEIGEKCRNDVSLLTDELREIKQEVFDTIHEGDTLEQQARFSRRRLSRSVSILIIFPKKKYGKCMKWPIGFKRI